MQGLALHLDIIMCLLWITTEALCLFGTTKYKRAFMSPLSQLFLAPIEVGAAIYFVFETGIFHYSALAYIAWSIIEFLIIKQYYSFKIIPKRRIKGYVIFIVILTIIITWFLFTTNWALSFFSCFNTMMAVIVWFVWIHRPEYPINLLSLIVFILKLVGDIIVICTYFNSFSFFLRCIIFILAFCDFLFILAWIWLYKKRKGSLLLDISNKGNNLRLRSHARLDSEITFPTMKRQTVSQKKYSKGWQSTKKKYKKKK